MSLYGAERHLGYSSTSTFGYLSQCTSKYVRAIVYVTPVSCPGPTSVTPVTHRQSKANLTRGMKTNARCVMEAVLAIPALFWKACHYAEFLLFFKRRVLHLSKSVLQLDERELVGER